MTDIERLRELLDAYGVNGSGRIELAFEIAEKSRALLDEVERLRAALEDIAAAERYRMWQACPDCDHRDLCNQRQRCEMQSKPEKIARAALHPEK